MRRALRSYYPRLTALFDRYEARLSALGLVIGFTLDNLTLQRIDVWMENLILITYILIATTGVVLINLYEGNFLKGRTFALLRSVAPFPIQIALGGLFSGFVVFYSRSTSISASLLFLVFLFAMLVGNEFFRSRYHRLTFQVSILFVAIFSYSVFAVPIIVGEMGARVFVLSGAVSIAIISVLVYMLSLSIPYRVRESKRSILYSIASIFLAMNALYFLNIIPPIPLSLKGAGVYHTVVRTGDGRYELTSEARSWYETLVRETVHVQADSPLSYFSAVFAPTRIATDIVHRWEFYNESRGEWETVLRLQYSIRGGRDGGYRGFTTKESMREGAWRVSVETARGQVLGRTRFSVQLVSQQPPLETVVQ